MRSTKAPSRGPITADVQAGEALFNRVGCAICHVAVADHGAGRARDQRRRVHGAGGARQQDHPPLQRLPAPRHRHRATASRSCRRPSSPTRANQMRTAPLWALRTRNRLMHDGLSFTKQEAIQRHQGQAESVRRRFDALPGRAEGAADALPRVVVAPSRSRMRGRGGLAPRLPMLHAFFTTVVSPSAVSTAPGRSMSPRS